MHSTTARVTMQKPGKPNQVSKEAIDWVSQHAPHGSVISIKQAQMIIWSFITDENSSQLSAISSYVLRFYLRNLAHIEKLNGSLFKDKNRPVAELCKHLCGTTKDRRIKKKIREVAVLLDLNLRMQTRLEMFKPTNRGVLQFKPPRTIRRSPVHCRAKVARCA